MGDLAGIGPEIVQKSLERIESAHPYLIIGSASRIQHRQLKQIKGIDEIGPKGFYLLEPDLENSTHHHSFEFVRLAVSMALRNEVAAIVTAPISKENWHKSGVHYKGHTDYLAESAKIQHYAMGFWAESLKTILYTIHIPLIDVAARMRTEPIVQFIEFVATELKRQFNRDFRFMIPGFNPHAGENGLMGREEIDAIIPAIESLKGKIDIKGPYPPDTIFVKALNQSDTVVISWYHDQGLIPFKLLNFHSGVNWTIGLPYIRTSPDHGTSFDIAGRDLANPSSMLEAIRLAEQLVSSRRAEASLNSPHNNSNC